MVLAVPESILQCLVGSSLYSTVFLFLCSLFTRSSSLIEYFLLFFVGCHSILMGLGSSLVLLAGRCHFSLSFPSSLFCFCQLFVHCRAALILCIALPLEYSLNDALQYSVTAAATCEVSAQGGGDKILSCY